MIKQKMQQDQVVAMKAHDSATVQTLRYILSQIKNKEIDNKIELDDAMVVDLLRKEHKKLQEASVSFRDGGREDLASENEVQEQIISRYLPKELSDDELREKVKEIFTSNSQVQKANPHALIGICISKLKSEADSSRIATMVKQQLDL